MIKRVLLFLITVILCGVICSAENKQISYSKAADYVIGYYVKAYIREITDSTFREKNFQKQWSCLEKNTVDNPITKRALKKIISALPDEDKHKTQEFYDRIKDKKTSEEGMTIDKLILLEKSDSSYLHSACSALKDNLKPYELTDTDKRSHSWWWLWLAVGLCCGIFVWEKCLREKYRFRFHQDEIRKSEDFLSRLQKDKKDLKKQNEMLNQKIEGYKKEIRDLQISKQQLLNENINLGKIIDSYKTSSVHFSKSQESSQKSYTSPIKSSSDDINCTTLYADTIIDGLFHRVKTQPDEDTVFELNLNKAMDVQASVTVFNDAYKRVIANPYFLQGCDKQVLNVTHEIEIESEGNAQRQADGKWKLLKKPNIIIK